MESSMHTEVASVFSSLGFAENSCPKLGTVPAKEGQFFLQTKRHLVSDYFKGNEKPLKPAIQLP